ncbi:MAG: phage tail protein [Thermosynechococcaceae cyanobacterium]
MTPRDRLYALLPAIYRLRDAEQGEPLRALLQLLTEELETVEADIAELYDNWFIETCDEWVVPYIGDLLSVRGLHTLQNSPYSQRAWVANTLSYRRRKGTAAILEQLARDVTGWPARVVEFFELLGTTQYLNHLRPQNLRTPDLRDLNGLELLDGPFDRIAHTVDVRTIRQTEGWYNIANIGLFLWRLQSYRVTGSTAREIQPGCYTFNPLGMDTPLFTNPDTETEITHLAEEINVPTPIRPGAFYSDLEAYKALPTANRPLSSTYYGRDRSLFIELFVPKPPPPKPPLPNETPTSIRCADLSNWPGPSWPTDLAGIILIDVRRGRLAFDPKILPTNVLVNYSYGFSGDVGGGPYNRQESLMQSLREAKVEKIDWLVGVSQEPSNPLGVPCIFPTLADAVTAWNALSVSASDGTVGAIALMDSRTYDETAANLEIQIKPGSRLWIGAATWLETEPYVPTTANLTARVLEQAVLVEETVPGVPITVRQRGPLRANELRPHILGNLAVHCDITEPSQVLGELLLNGLLIEGQLTVQAGNLSRLRLDHCTLVPDKGGLLVESGTADSQRNEELEISLNRCITGVLQLAETVPKLWICDSIVNTGATPAGVAIAAPGTTVEIQSSTLFGSSQLGELEASNSLFTAIATVRRAQMGCVRFCYVPDGSRVPRRYRCQPQLAIEQRAKALNLETLPTDERTLIVARVRPAFTAEDYGQPGYAQLSLGCAEEILTGAEDGSEMGVFDHLKQPQREANLRVGLEEYLRFGLEAGLIFVT